MAELPHIDEPIPVSVGHKALICIPFPGIPNAGAATYIDGQAVSLAAC